MPVRAGQPDPACRLLHGLLTSWKYRHRVRCNRFPPTVAMFRSCPDAPESNAWDSTGKSRRMRRSPARSLFRTPAPIRSPPPSSWRQCSVDSRETSTSGGGGGDAEAHQIDEIRAATQEDRARVGGDRVDGFRRGGGPEVAEGPHRGANAAAAASRTAGTMFA